MFFLNCKPLRNTHTICDFSKFLFDRFLLPHYQAKVNEVHMLFDAPRDMNKFNPKVYEQKRRDNSIGCASSHQHVKFNPSTEIATISWSSFISCRECKRSVIEAIGLAFLQSVRLQLRPEQVLYLSGCFGNNSTLMLSGNPQSLPSPASNYKSNSAEADMRIWRHATQTTGRHILIYSPDTDIYNIGLSLFEILTNKDVYVQIDVLHSQTKLYIHINDLIKALQLDPDLANLEKSKLANIFQMLFITSGCDYVSFFSGHGKSAFFQVFFQHADFITGRSMPGSLSDSGEKNKENGFLAFLRLIGTLYFKKHYSAIVSLKGSKTPHQLFNACNGANQHIEWYNTIRAIVSDRILCEEDRMPSHTSMWRHWLRSCWIAQMWFNSFKEDIHDSLPQPDFYGWTKNNDGNYVFDWECPSVQKLVLETITFLTKGCSCKKGCTSQRCGCRKGGHSCVPGCSCQNCTNVQQVHRGCDMTDSSVSSSLESDSSSGDSEEEIEEEIVFPEFQEQNINI